MMRNWFAHSLIALSGLGFAASESFAQNAAQRQAERNERQIERQSQRLENRGTYYDAQTWTQIEPWLTRNRVRPLERAANVASAAARAVDAAADVSPGRATTGPGAVATYGYSNATSPASGQGWFYDYYRVNPTFYGQPIAGANAYGAAARYRDLDGDGVYDELETYRDTANAGTFNTYTRYDFRAEANNDAGNTSVAQGNTNAATEPGLREGKLTTVSGQVNATKTAKVGNQQHLIAHLIGPSGSDINAVVDMGPAERWKLQPINQGDKVTASGTVEQVGEKQLVIAQTITLPGQQAIQIDRFGSQVQGEVVDVMRTRVRDAEHIMAVVDTGEVRQVVDLGPVTNLKVQVEPRTQIVVHGMPVSARNHNVLMADRVNIAGQTYTIERW